jgi:hypothetical protein
MRTFFSSWLCSDTTGDSSRGRIWNIPWVVDGVQLALVGELGGSTSCGRPSPSSGNSQYGTWECDIEYSSVGLVDTWTVAAVTLTDSNDNIRQYQTSELQALGFPTQLDVTYGAGPPP